ncbi:1-(5-phosphoribosyl)-5-amino-4-imidazole-carboxyl ate carboxylase [Desulfosarcina widdelii]|uniref:1-(5-phosphoribosyl)-5-amino-4-imidazole-carboxyl ate carboxylase n=1 Tax=Desulfosarcina widdelii TaxID=947919 RepID=A0A5K7ZJL9_9BACT|nr:nickel pincer cofactor biosynthesis protein LarB [Desulfosarcina widdelii]BBO78464.1 1-(5-phosphoribosyl)-5-amino-4-imidazole-carboxyl ate carboxylase [Desulfosarcina widdelii]
MNADRLKDLLENVKKGDLSVDHALETLKDLPYADLGYAMVDHHRSLRSGYPETIFSQGKTVEQVVGIARRLLEKNVNIMATRADRNVYEALQAIGESVEYHAAARIAVINRQPVPPTRTTILVMCAGTSDIPVAEEAAVTAEVMGNRVERLADVGVAGIHRLLAKRKIIQSASVLVVVAGMDGALPSVTAGLTDKPVIAVPTSIGYGASFGGLAALLTMLNSCANGVTVVNIDNGYGAGYAASLINRMADRAAGTSQNPPL